MSLPRLLVSLAVVLSTAHAVAAEAVVSMELADPAAGQPNVFPHIPAASATDAGNAAKLTLIDGQRDGNGAQLTCLNDGKLADSADAPRSNFFLSPAVPSGRLLVEWDKPHKLHAIRSYSRHPDGRGPQRYAVYVRPTAKPAPAEALATDPKSAGSGWSLLAEVDTRPLGGAPAGCAVAITPDETDKAAAQRVGLGRHRYLLFVLEKVDPADRFGQTFYSEIDLDDGAEHPPAPKLPGRSTLEIEGGYAIDFDTTETPQLTAWVDKVLKPTCAEWYPKIVAAFPTEGYKPPKRFGITFRADMNGVAFTAGTNVVCAGPWFENNLQGEAAGAVVHELVHVVQQYRRGPNRTPGWLVEGLADYLRWFQYEPVENRPRPNLARAKYTDSYRTTAAFLDYVTRTYDAEAPAKLNDLSRRGEYTEQVWKDLTGRTADDLWLEYVQSQRNQ
ncbi:MAG: hypothetical protein KDA44_21080 [Planctomycetales bacterium]|nr:hypothetical protein [Planctomycetales bacterium]